jgi:DNA-binding PadR family transcriptional regulator
MSLPFGLLGLLEYSSNTGYDLTKLFEKSINNFWHAQSSQIYRELNRMEEKGWVSSESIIQQGKPNKRLYSITEEGRKAFREWMNTPAKMIVGNPHNLLLMYIMFGASAPEATLRRLKGVRGAININLDGKAKEVQDFIDNYKTTVPGGEERSIYWQMAQEYGITQAKATVQWAEEWIEKLEKNNEEEKENNND